MQDEKTYSSKSVGGRRRLDMADLQAEIELTIELRKFVNIDLFVQGYDDDDEFLPLFTCVFISFRYYQIRTGVKFASRIQSATKIEIKSELPTVLGKLPIVVNMKKKHLCR